MYGEPGAGKSALMALFCAELLDKSESSSVVSAVHIVGASPRSFDLSDVIRRIVMGLVSNNAASSSTTAAATTTTATAASSSSSLSSSSAASSSTPTNNLRSFFTPEALAKLDSLPHDPAVVVRNFATTYLTAISEAAVAADKVVVIVIDGLNQMHAAYNCHTLWWCPSALPPNIRIIISLVPQEHNLLLTFRSHHPAPEEMYLPLLDEDSSRQVVRDILRKCNKSLTEDDKNSFLGNQMGIIMSKDHSKSPLFLVSVCAVLLQYGIYEKLTEYLRALPGLVICIRINGLFADVCACLFCLY